jgi:hypothetical protein
MRLSEDKARRLSALIWRDRLRRWGPVFLAALALFGAFTFYLTQQVGRLDRTLDVRVHEATVLKIKRPGTARAGAVVQVHLDDGRDVDAIAAVRLAAVPGAHVTVSEARHASGRSTFDVTGFAK